MTALPSSLPPSFTLGQAAALGLSRWTVRRLVQRGALLQVGRGVFRRADVEDVPSDLVDLALRVPQATLCLETALARHGLSDALITAPDVAIPRGTRRPVTASPVRWHVFHPDTFELGRVLVELEPGVQLGLYSAERSIVDAFRLRGREGYEVAYEALRRWLRHKGADPAKLMALAEQLPRATSPLRRALEVLL